MTKLQAVAMFEAGIPCIMVEVRKSIAERIKWRDKASKQMMEAPLLRHSVESADGTPYTVNERVPQTFDEVAYKSPFKKGDKAVLRYVSMTTERGATSFSGTLEKVD